MKRRYAPGRTKKKILFEVELQTLEKLEKISKEQIFASRKKERQKAVSVNPFLSMMYKSMSFNVWLDIYSKLNSFILHITYYRYLYPFLTMFFISGANLKKRAHHMELGLEREISDEEEDDDVEEAS